MLCMLADASGSNVPAIASKQGFTRFDCITCARSLAPRLQPHEGSNRSWTAAKCAPCPLSSSLRMN